MTCPNPHTLSVSKVEFSSTAPPLTVAQSAFVSLTIINESPALKNNVLKTKT